MGVASVIHSGIPRLSPVPNRVRLQLAYYHIVSFRTGLLSLALSVCLSLFLCIDALNQHPLECGLAVDCRRRTEYCPIACSRGTEREDHLSTSADNLGETQGNESHHSSVRTVALSVGAAVAFGTALGMKDGLGKASEFFAGYILEQSLSVDNLFVFVLIFKYFKVPFMYQNRVLSYGIAGAIVFRLTLILLGTATLQRFEAVNLLLAAVLLYSSFKLFASEDDDTDLSNNFVVKTCQRFIPVTTSYDGNRFITTQDGVWKVSNILDRPHLYFSR